MPDSNSNPPANGAGWLRDLRQIVLLLAGLASTGVLGTGWYQSNFRAEELQLRNADRRADVQRIAVERDEEQAIAHSCVEIMRETNGGYALAVASEQAENIRLAADVKRLRDDRDENASICYAELQRIRAICAELANQCTGGIMPLIDAVPPP